jgi:two-component system NtrC family sensor kinase
MQKHVTSRSEGRNKPYEVEWLKKNGEVLPTIVSPMPLFNENGEFSGNVAVLTDVTQLKRIEKELIEKNRQLEEALRRASEMQEHLILAEKMASLGQVTAGIAHEIKNPLAFMKGNVNPLQRDFQQILQVLEKYESTVSAQDLQPRFSEIESFKDEVDFQVLVKEVNNLLEGMREGADRITQIVRSLGYFSKSGEEELSLSDVHQGIDSTLMLLSGETGDRIGIQKEYGDLPEIECYPGKLNQVFMNLLSNAIQAIHGQGKIVIKTARDGDNIRISIKDSGRGMPSEVQDRIFEPFFTTKELGQGSGLGLSISYNIIAQHSGKIMVNSEPGIGTEFIISLPEKQSKKQ